MDFDNHFNMYGITVSPFGIVDDISFKDILENMVLNEKRKDISNQFMSNEKEINTELRSLEMYKDKFMAQQPQKPAAGGRLFRVKPKASHGKYY